MFDGLSWLLPLAPNFLPVSGALAKTAHSRGGKTALIRGRACCAAPLIIWGFSVLLGVESARAQAVDVKVYSGFTSAGGGAPYSGLVGELRSPDIKFATNLSYNWHPFGRASFGADLMGELSVSTAGRYPFSLNSDDGSQLFIDGSLVVDNGGPHPPATVTGFATLSAGTHRFEVQFFECCGGPSGVDLTLPTGVNYANFFLSFPIPAAPSVHETNARCLHNTKCTAYNANITSVMDHTGTPLDSNSNTRQGKWYQEDLVPITDRAVTAYTGETGTWANGRDANKASGYKNASGTKFVINGNYVGAKSDAENCGVGVLDCPCKATSSCAPTFLNYDGHSGYDYPFSGANTNGQGGTQIVAPATGQLYKATDDLVNISSVCDRANIKGWDRWHSFYIVHGTGTSDADFVPNGYSSWYLHADRLDAAIDAAITANGHAFVQPNTRIAYVGCYGPRTTRTTCTKTPLHLCGTHLSKQVRRTHFDVNGKPDSLDTEVIDPYAANLWLR